MRKIILSHYRKMGVGPIGTALFNFFWIGGPIRDQPPARTRVVLRSAAQPQNAATLKTSEDSQAMLIAAHRLASMLGKHSKNETPKKAR